MGLAASHRPGRGPGPAPSPGPFYRDPFYQTGTANPRLRSDPGAGMWNSKRIEVESLVKLQAIKAILGVPTLVYPGPNATRHMWHYLHNTGRPYTIDLEGMIRSVPTAKRAMVAEFRQAQRFVTGLPAGKHNFMSIAGENSYNYKSESADWFFAIGGYTYWGKGVASITGSGLNKSYEVDFEYHVYDRYNWDGGKSVTIGGVEVTDEFMGEFHRQGLAREFDCFGKVVRRFVWKGAVPPADDLIVQRQGR
jgi:hypothetical protein